MFLLRPALGLTTLLYLSSFIASHPDVEERNRRYLRSDTTTGLNFLTLGGSVTWGAALDERYDAYPYLLGTFPNHSDNMAIRATGAAFPSQCIESMVGDTVYDVIVLEFTLNGDEGLDQLLRRLRLRFPKAVLVYVHLYSLQAEAVDVHGRTPGDLRVKDLSIDWSWGKYKEHNDKLIGKYRAMMEKVGGHIYTLPRADLPEHSVDFFGADWHHLSPMGHGVVAEGIMDIVKQSLPQPIGSQPQHLGTWGKGDECWSWFKSGENPLPVTNGVMNQMGWDKYVLEFKQPGKITMVNSRPTPVPLYISYMTRNANYPVTEITVNGQVNKTVDPNINTKYHITQTTRITMAKPGENVVEIRPEDNHVEPFRLTAIILCGYCGDPSPLPENEDKAEEVK